MDGADNKNDDCVNGDMSDSGYTYHMEAEDNGQYNIHREEISAYLKLFRFLL